MAVKQQGASVTFGVTGGTWEFVNIGRYAEPIPVIDDTHLGTTGKRTKIAGDLGDPQMVTIVIQGKPTSTTIVRGVNQTITITGPLNGGSSAEKWAGTGFIVDVRTPEFASDSEAIQTVEIDFQFDGKTGPARTAQS